MTAKQPKRNPLHPALDALPESGRYQSGPGAMAAYLPGGPKWTGAMFEDAEQGKGEAQDEKGEQA